MLLLSGIQFLLIFAFHYSSFCVVVSDATIIVQRRKMEGHGEMGVLGENFDAGLIGRIRDDGYESRSGSDNFEGVSLSGEDDQDAGDDTPQRRKKYHRHTPHQIQELES